MIIQCYLGIAIIFVFFEIFYAHYDNVAIGHYDES